MHKCLWFICEAQTTLQELTQVFLVLSCGLLFTAFDKEALLQIICLTYDFLATFWTKWLCAKNYSVIYA